MTDETPLDYKGVEVKRNPSRLPLLVLGILIVAVFAIVLFQSGKGTLSVKANYPKIYTLVEDKVSMSAPIQINLPKFNRAEGTVTFDPQIPGKWLESDQKDTMIYQPNKKLELGKYYSVTYSSKGGQIKKDFQADEDPAVVDVFPKADSEADESSSITIVFNRPMVPLTTLGILEKNSLPIAITPVTDGKWKWISTRNLQFIPAHGLLASSHYTVQINAGIQSIDGLSVKPFSHSFTTRPIRYLSSSNGQILYDQPIYFRYNQPVDLLKTTASVHLSDAGRAVPFDTAYGKRRVYDEEGKSNEVEDQSVLAIYPKSDRFGREHLWDFKHSYQAIVDKAFPKTGDIAYGQKEISYVTVTDIVKEFSVVSSSTALASADLFDPLGEVHLSFYEDINLSASDIEIKGLKAVKYDKKCQETQNKIYDGPCVMEEDRERTILTFDPAAFSLGEKVPIVLKKIVNKDGLQLNAEEIDLYLTVYPKLQILSTTPANGAQNGSVSDLVICTNSPLAPKAGADFYKAVATEGYSVLGRWNFAYKQTQNSYEKNPPCDPGQFVNRIRYGLLPSTDYTFKLNVTDVFGQKLSEPLSFRTEKAPKFYLRFHALDKIYNVTTPGKTKLTYGVENFDKVYLNICKADPVSMVKYLEQRLSNIESSDGLDCLDQRNDVIDIPPRLWVNNYFQVDISKYFADPRGQYILTFTNPEYKDYQGRQMFERSYLSVTNLAVGEKKVYWTKYDDLPQMTKNSVDSTSAEGEIYWVNRIADLSAVQGAVVTVLQNISANSYGSADVEVADVGKTDAAGLAKLPLIKDVVGAAITSGGDSAVISSWSDNLNWAGSANSGKMMYVYTDRPIYRPGQEVNIKGIYRLGFDGSYEIFDAKPVTIRVTDARGKDILNQSLAVSKFGTFNTTIKIPDDAPLGGYSISADRGYAWFEVEEYQGAAFEAKAQSQKDEYIAGDDAVVSISGKYYFGVPVSDGTVSYSLTAQDYYFDRYTDEYFNFGADWYNCYDCGYGDTFIKSGQLTLDQDGSATFTQKLDFQELFKNDSGRESKILVLHATIKDKQGKSVSTESSFIVHRGEFYLGTKTDPYFVGTNQPFALKIKSVDTKGKPLSRGGIKLVVNKVTWQSYKRQEVDGGYYNRPERLLAPVIQKAVSTNNNGDYNEQYSLKDSGEYEIDISAKDGRDNDILATGHLYIYGGGSVSVRPTNNATLDITSEKTDVKTGDMAKFIFQSPYKSAKALVTLERGRIFEYHIVDVNQNMVEYEFPITEAMVPNIYASVLLISSDPEAKFGQLQFTVDRQKKQLNINVTSDKLSYLPGEKVNLHITTTDYAGKPASAELSVSVADVSVLALKGNPKKDPLLFFYNGFPLTVTTGTNIKNILTEAEIPTGVKGGGGGDAEDLAKKQRGEFRDTAYWQANVVTDQNGTANVSFTLPDNITRWQVESLGVTKDTKLGVKYNELVAQKNIMLVPLKPRFVVPGDEFELGAQVFNQTAVPQTLTITYQSDTLKMEGGDGSTKQTIKAGENATFYFKVKAPQSMTSGSHTFVLSAHNDNFDDTVKNEIPINENLTYEAVATANSTSAKSAEEYVYIPEGVVSDQGGLTVKTSATLAVFLSDALKYMVQYPYGCTEQILSKLSSIAIVKRGLSLPNISEKFSLPPVEFSGNKYSADDVIKIGLAKIYDNQNYDGGFAYYKGLESSQFLTMEVIKALSDIRDAGYEVDNRVTSNAVNYLYSTLRQKGISYWGADTYIAAAYAVYRADINSAALTYFMDAIRPYLTTAYINERSGSATLTYLAMLSLGEGWGADMTNLIYTSLQNRVNIDSRGAYLKAGSSDYNWQFYETPIKDTALLVKALAKRRTDYSLTDKLLRWILASRAKDGAWGSTQNTLTVIDAFTDYLSWKRETESNFILKLSLDGTSVETWDFNPKTILSIFDKFLPISAFSPNSVHVLAYTKDNRNDLPNNFYYDMALKYYLPTEDIAPRDEGISLTRELYRLDDTAEAAPLTEVKVGDVVKGKLTLITGKARHALSVEDFIPAGFELVNFNLSTEDQSSIEQPSVKGQAPEALAEMPEGELVTRTTSDSNGGFLSMVARPWSDLLAAVWSNGRLFGDVDQYNIYEQGRVFQSGLSPDFKELRDDRLFLFKEYLPAGQYTYEYYLRATTPGTFRYLPAVASEMYYPENFGRTGGALFEVTR